MIRSKTSGEQYLNFNFTIRNERVCGVWKEEREIYDSVFEEVTTDTNCNPRKRKQTTNLEFLDHLLDVHRIWCRSCRPSASFYQREGVINQGGGIEAAEKNEETSDSKCQRAESPQSLGVLQSNSSNKQIEGSSPRGKNPNTGTQFPNIKGEMVKMHAKDVKGNTSKIRVINVTKSTAGVCKFEKLTTIPPSLTHTSISSTSTTRVAKKLSDDLDLLKGATLTTAPAKSGQTLNLSCSPTETVDDTSDASKVSLPVDESFPDSGLCMTSEGFCQATCVDEDDDDEDDIYDDGTVQLSDVADVPTSSGGAQKKQEDVEQKRFSMQEQSPQMEPPCQQETLWTVPTGTEDQQDSVDSNEAAESEEGGWLEVPQDMETSDLESEPDSLDTSHSQAQSSPEIEDMSDEEGSSQPVNQPGTVLKERVRIFAISKSQKASTGKDNASGSSEEEAESGDESKFECIFCDYTSQDSHQMDDHLQTHVPSEPGSFTLDLKKSAIKRKNWNLGWCEDCKKLFMDITTHVHTVHHHESVLCTICSKVVKYKLYQRHMASHGKILEKNLPTCETCHAVFRFKKLLKEHVRNVHAPKKKKFECETCGKIFKRQCLLAKHEIIHSMVKPFYCNHCGKGFTQKCNLKVHLRQHTGQKPYSCEFCDAAFTNNVTLKQHKKKLHGVDWWKMNAKSAEEKTESLMQK